MKLPIFRKSGGPVNEEAQEAFLKDWQEFYDRAETRAQTKHKEGKYSDQYNLLLQRYLRFGDRMLHKKHDTQVMEEIPKNAKQWTDLIKKYKDTPLGVALRADGSGLVLIILDEFR